MINLILKESLEEYKKKKKEKEIKNENKNPLIQTKCSLVVKKKIKK